MHPAIPFLPTPWFRQDYPAARSLFLRQTEAFTHAQYSNYTHPLTGPLGEPLATDVLWLGPSDSCRVVVIISATHGIEGYAGSAIQSFLLQALQQGQLQLPGDTALLFVHALNPWGMAWHRRCDEQGIDINRNFIDFSQPLPQAAGYKLVQPWMFCADSRQRQQGLQQVAQQLGQRGYEEALSGGQYEDATAPFYGGTGPAFARNCIEQIMARYQLERRQLVVLDLHTGLGPWSYGELICDHPFNSPQQHFAQRLFGAAVALPADGSSSSVPKLGLLDYAWHAIMANNSCFLTLEFGSYSTSCLFDTLINNHIIWARGEPASACHSKGKDDMLDHFCPQDIYWQQALLFQAWQKLHLLFHRWIPT